MQPFLGIRNHVPNGPGLVVKEKIVAPTDLPVLFTKRVGQQQPADPSNFSDYPECAN
jgi:hypothetical protein